MIGGFLMSQLAGLAGGYVVTKVAGVLGPVHPRARGTGGAPRRAQKINAVCCGRSG